MHNNEIDSLEEILKGIDGLIEFGELDQARSVLRVLILKLKGKGERSCLKCITVK